MKFDEKGNIVLENGTVVPNAIAYAIYRFIDHDINKLDVISVIAGKFNTDIDAVKATIPDDILEDATCIFEKARTNNNNWSDDAEYAVYELKDKLNELFGKED